jgi:hypothetical protein
MCVGAVWKRFDAPVHPYTESAGTDWHRVKTLGKYCLKGKELIVHPRD